MIEIFRLFLVFFKQIYFFYCFVFNKIYLFFFIVSFIIGCNGTKFKYNFSPKTLVFLPDIHFCPPKPFHFLISIPQPIFFEFFYIWWFFWKSQKWLAFTFSIFYSKRFPVFDHNLCASGANYDVFIELDLLPWLWLSEIQTLLKFCLGMQNVGRRA